MERDQQRAFGNYWKVAVAEVGLVAAMPASMRSSKPLNIAPYSVRRHEQAIFKSRKPLVAQCRLLEIRQPGSYAVSEVFASEPEVEVLSQSALA